MHRSALAWAGLGLWLSLASACVSEPFTAAVAEAHGSAAGEDGDAGGRAGFQGQGGRASGKGGAGFGTPHFAGGAGAVGGESGGSSGSSVVGSPSCPDLQGEKLVPADGFCIDESEVTAASYQAFLETQPSVAEQPYECLGNHTFKSGCQYTKPAQEPVRCMDWCDARAYCVSVGKRLCGSATASEGAMPYDAAATDLDNQWYAACSHAGESVYPYAGEYDDSACWGADHPPASVMLTKSAAACVGGYDGLWDMSGSMAEWIDSCSDDKGLTDACRIRGGSHGATADQLRCDWQSATARDTSSLYIGFRCCADLD